MSEIRDIKPTSPITPVRHRERESPSQRQKSPPPKPRSPIDEQDNPDRPGIDEYV